MAQSPLDGVHRLARGDRLCVEDSTTKEEVEKFVMDFLKHLVS